MHYIFVAETEQKSNTIRDNDFFKSSTVFSPKCNCQPLIVNTILYDSISATKRIRYLPQRQKHIAFTISLHRNVSKLGH